MLRMCLTFQYLSWVGLLSSLFAVVFLGDHQRELYIKKLVAVSKLRSEVHGLQLGFVQCSRTWQNQTQKTQSGVSNRKVLMDQNMETVQKLQECMMGNATMPPPYDPPSSPSLQVSSIAQNKNGSSAAAQSNSSTTKSSN